MSTAELSPANTPALPLSTERLFAFPCDPGRGRLLYDVIKERLAESFQQIAAVSASVAEIDGRNLADFLSFLTASRKVSPRFFAIYYEILEAVGEDNVDSVSRLFAQLVIADTPDSVPSYNLTDEHLGSGNAARYARWADMDPENPISLVPLAPAEFDRIAALKRDALDLMDAGAPEVSGEIRALLAEVVFASGELGENLLFNGISSFYLWGTIILNAEGHKTTLQLLQTLAHETAHMHLFAVALDSPLVRNPEEERYASPLRLDPRPMDGIYHATYVTARMHYVLTRLMASGVLSAAQLEEAKAACANHLKSFREGYESIASQGDLTDLGRNLMSRAHAYMSPYLEAAHPSSN